MTATAVRSVRVRGREYPVDLPTLRDPRLHLAAVIISIHVLGQVTLGFHVSVAQILAAIITCAVIEVVWTVRRTGRLVWPASALLTGSGVGLIFRVLGTESGDYWSMRGWHLFALVAAGSLLSKYVIRYQGSHVFNPSNLGLVVAFLLLGSSRAEPLDFWWTPFGPGMAAAYAIILAGGLLITARLRLLAMGVAFWITLSAGMGVLVASGHCITARWAFEPVCGSHFWWIIVTSPEIMIFLFFMITDPKTVPAGRVGRVAFGASVALLCTLLIAPQATEFGAKVALLGGLVLLTAARPLFDRVFPVAGSERDRLGRYARELLAAGRERVAPARLVLRVVMGISAVVLLAAGVAAAGAPAREPVLDIDAEALPAITFEIDPASLPAVTVDPEVAELDGEMATTGAQGLAEALAVNLGTEAQALLSGDKTLLAGADVGPRLVEMEQTIDEAAATGRTVVPSYSFDSLRLIVTYPMGEQLGASPALEARGVVEEVTYVGGEEVSRTESPCAITFSLRRPVDGRWLIVRSTPIES